MGRCGERGRRGDTETRGHGDAGTRRRGDTETRRGRGGEGEGERGREGDGDVGAVPPCLPQSKECRGSASVPAPEERGGGRAFKGMFLTIRRNVTDKGERLPGEKSENYPGRISTNDSKNPEYQSRTISSSPCPRVSVSPRLDGGSPSPPLPLLTYLRTR